MRRAKAAVPTLSPSFWRGELFSLTSLTSLTSFEKEVSKKTFGMSVFYKNSKDCFLLSRKRSKQETSCKRFFCKNRGGSFLPLRKGGKQENFWHECLLKKQQGLLSCCLGKGAGKKTFGKSLLLGFLLLTFLFSKRKVRESRPNGCFSGAYMLLLSHKNKILKQNRNLLHQ